MYKVILILIVIAVGAGSFFWPRQKHDTVWWQDECIRMELAQQLTLAKFRLEMLDAANRTAESVLDEQALTTARLEDLRSRREKLTGIIEQKGNELVAYREEVVQGLRNRAVGKAGRNSKPQKPGVLSMRRVVFGR